MIELNRNLQISFDLLSSVSLTGENLIISNDLHDNNM